MDQAKRDRRKLNKQKRMQLMIRERQLSDNFCNSCPFSSLDGLSHCNNCPIFGELRHIGEQMESLSNSAFIVPNELTWSVYLTLRGREWTKKDIARHYKIPILQFNEFVASNENPTQYTYKEMDKLTTEQTTETKTAKPTLKDLTPEMYKDLIASGKTDNAITGLYDASYYTLNNWKKKNGFAKETGKRNKTEKTPSVYVSADKMQKLKDELARKDKIIEQKDALLVEAESMMDRLNDTYALEAKKIESQTKAIERYEARGIEQVDIISSLEAEAVSLREQLKNLTVKSLKEATKPAAAPPVDEESELFVHMLLKRLMKSNEQVAQLQAKYEGGVLKHAN